MTLGVFRPLPFLWKSLRRMGIGSSLHVWQNSPVKVPTPGLLFAGSFFFVFCLFYFLFAFDKFDFTTGDQPVQIVYFFLVWS